MSRHTSRTGRPLELVRGLSEPDPHAREKIAFYCETQGPVPAASQSAADQGQAVVPVPRARLIDVLLYPMSLDGLAVTVVFALGLWMIRLFAVFFRPWSYYRVTLVMTFWGLFAAWCAANFFAICLFDSSKGGTRAPGVLPAYPYGGGDLGVPRLLGAIALGLGPSVLYYLFSGNLDWLFLLLALAGTFPLPMVVLAGTLIDSAEAFDPRLIARSIAATLPAYLGLNLRLALLAALGFALYLDAGLWRLPRVLPYAMLLYLLWIAGHLLGRFYLRHKDKLGWGV